jgi:hypothetical protein
MPDWAILLLGIAGYVILMKFILPRFGMPT